jgi:hypothetical protein
MAIPPARRTYPELGPQTTVQDTDLLATYRGAGPLKKITVANLFANRAKTDLSNLGTAVSTIQPASPAIFRYGQSNLTPSSGDEFGNLRSPFGFFNNSMNYYATNSTVGYGTQWVMTIGGFVPPGIAPTYVEQKGGLYVSVRSGRESNGTTPFSDTTGIQVNTNIIAGTVAGRAYGMHINNTIDGPSLDPPAAAANGQAVGLEIEVNQIGGSIERDLFAVNQKTALQLVPIGKEMTKGIMFGVNTGGTYNQMMYVEQSSVRQAISTPVVLPSGRFDYGGSFFAVGDGGGTGGFIYRKCNINGYLVTANGKSEPRFSAQVVEDVLRPNGQVVNIWGTNFAPNQTTSQTATAGQTVFTVANATLVRSVTVQTPPGPAVGVAFSITGTNEITLVLPVLLNDIVEFNLANGYLSQEYSLTATFNKSCGIDVFTREWRVSNVSDLRDDANILIGTHTNYVNFFGSSASARFRFVNNGNATYAKIGLAGFAFSAVGTDVSGNTGLTRGNDLTAAPIILGNANGVTIGAPLGFSGGTGVIGLTATGVAPTTLSTGVALWYDDATNAFKYRKAGDATIRTITFT